MALTTSRKQTLIVAMPAGRTPQLVGRYSYMTRINVRASGKLKDLP